MLVPESEKWDFALGMAQIDGGEPSPEMKKMVEQEKRGEITMADIRRRLDEMYPNVEEENA